MKNIIICASGPAKKKRHRHLEKNKYNGEIIITDLIKKCTIPNTNLYVLIHESNGFLHKYLNRIHPKIKLIINNELTIFSTYKKALDLDGDCILVSGDLINLKIGDINKFVDTKIKSGISKYKIPWGENIKKNNLFRRGDVGEAVSFFSEEHKKEFLSDKNLKQAEKNFNLFHPNRKINYNVMNDLGLYMHFSFFYDIYTDLDYDNSKLEKGYIEFDHKIYEDND